MSGLDQFPGPLTQSLITLIHFRQPLLMLGESGVKFINRMRSTGTDSDQRCGLEQRANGYNVLLLLDLRGEEAYAPSHFFGTSDLGNEGTLKRVDVRVQL